MIDCRKFVNSPITVLGQPAKVFARTRTSVGLQPQRTHRSILNQFSCLQGFIRFPGTLLLTLEKKKKRRQMDSVVDFPQLIYPNSVINTVSYLTDQCEKGKSQITSIQLKTTNQPIIAQEAKVSPLYKVPMYPKSPHCSWTVVVSPFSTDIWSCHGAAMGLDEPPTGSVGPQSSRKCATELALCEMSLTMYWSGVRWYFKLFLDILTYPICFSVFIIMYRCNHV